MWSMVVRELELEKERFQYLQSKAGQELQRAKKTQGMKVHLTNITWLRYVVYSKKLKNGYGKYIKIVIIGDSARNFSSNFFFGCHLSKNNRGIRCHSNGSDSRPVQKESGKHHRLAGWMSTISTLLPNFLDISNIPKSFLYYY